MLTIAVAYASGAAAPQAKRAALVPHAATGPTLSVSFTPNQPGKTSGFSFTAASPTQPASVTVTLPAGTALNLAAVPVCGGPPACDPSTQVGTGQAQLLYNGSAIPVSFTVYNTTGGAAIVITVPNRSPVVILPTWSGSSFTVPYPNTVYKGYPIQIVSLTMTFNTLGSGAKSFIRSPSTCTSAGWSSTATFNFSSAAPASVTAAAKCSATAPKKKPKHKKKKKSKKKSTKKK
jgi:hypothetical protein